MFHLGACNAHEGEFADYSAAEQDAVIREFRDIIIEAKLTSFAAAIDRRVWNELVVGGYRARLGDDLTFCIRRCVEETIRIAGPHPQGDAIAVTFDRGMWLPGLKEATDPYTYHLGRPRIVSINALCVVDFLPLQGADIVATESYWHAGAWLKLGDAAQPRPHLRHFLDNMFAEAVILDRARILDLLSRCDEEEQPS